MILPGKNETEIVSLNTFTQRLWSKMQWHAEVFQNMPIAPTKP